MTNFLQCGDNYKVSIPRWKDIDKRTFYIIEIEIDQVKWTVDHRYSEFAKLHQGLVTEHGVTSDILPPKKTIGNREESFIEKRRASLEAYLVVIVRFLQKAMPKELALFLNFNKFDIPFIVKGLAVKFYQYGETILSKVKNYTFTPLELFAINERLKQPCSSIDLMDQREDFSHVLDFCCQLPELTIKGNNYAIQNSNIVPNTLEIQLAVFKSLETLTLDDVECSKIKELGSLRYTLKNIHVNNCKLDNLIDLALCDQIHKTDLGPQNAWNALTKLTVSYTHISNIDAAIRIMPKLQFLSIDNNKISDIESLEFVPLLNYLSAKKNHLNLIEVLFANNLKVLDLSENQIISLKPFEQLASLENLNLQMNRISDVNEVFHISNLPCLENIVLTGNPVSQIVDYRVKVLEYFGNRAFRICLDNESTNQKELDKVAILKALHAPMLGQIDVPP